MKRFKPWPVIVLAALVLTLLPAMALAESQPRLRLAVENAALEVGQEVTVTIWVEDAAPIYGVQSNLTFDSDVLEVVALEHGDFLAADPEQEAFVLQNRFDNEAGTVDYALSLLNPAPPVEGSGRLATIHFRGKAEGQAAIAFRDGRLGTQSGDEIMPHTESVLLTVGQGPALPAGEPESKAEPMQPAAPESDKQPVTEQGQAPGAQAPGAGSPSDEAGVQGPDRSTWWIAAGALLCLAIAGGGYWLGRRQRSSPQRRRP